MEKSNLFSFFQCSLFPRPRAREEDNDKFDRVVNNSKEYNNGKEYDNGKEYNNHDEDDDDGGKWGEWQVRNSLTKEPTSPK